MAQGGPKPSSFYLERQALTRSPATPAALSDKSSNFAYGQNDPGQGNTNPGDGLVLAGVMAIVVSVYPNTGQTLGGTGSLLCWVFNPYQRIWTRCDQWDLDLATTTGFQGKTFDTISNISRLGSLINWLSSGVTASAGSDILVRLDGFTSVGGQAI